ncbi:hypothetical protein OHA40_34470 [Nocardia sp. NBC_00508]|uniref:hypothetical protein n=1 Tax=Nocardia sp. NBC_00508 TaxID=2975992 RepID=UPI002E80C130|nr:hypothetical protein [Nocardia sp. NBC_00508]WUD66581.1 hypothetical protein OHA40_34470 [Nocardia sp. NBC_00508]
MAIVTDPARSGPLGGGEDAGLLDTAPLHPAWTPVAGQQLEGPDALALLRRTKELIAENQSLRSELEIPPPARALPGLTRPVFEPRYRTLSDRSV